MSLLAFCSFLLAFLALPFFLGALLPEFALVSFKRSFDFLFLPLRPFERFFLKFVFEPLQLRFGFEGKRLAFGFFLLSLLFLAAWTLGFGGFGGFDAGGQSLALDSLYPRGEQSLLGLHGGLYTLPVM